MVENEVWLSRKAAAIYLTRLGVPMTHEYLSKLALAENAGKGPKFLKSGWKTVRYSKTELDAFIKRKVEVCG